MSNLRAVLESFTPNDEIDSFIEGDITTMLIGYVDAIEGCRASGRTLLYKIVVNNGQGRRVNVLFWDMQAERYKSLIHLRKIITIMGCRPSRLNPNYVNPAELIAPLQLNVLQYTDVILGDLFDDGISILIVRESDIEHVCAYRGVVFVTGYIKSPFELIFVAGNSFGCGVIANGLYKLRVKIENFIPNENLLTGQQVKLRGEIKEDQDGNIHFQVQSSSDIQLLGGFLSLDIINQGVRTPRSSRLFLPPLRVE